MATSNWPERSTYHQKRCSLAEAEVKALPGGRLIRTRSSSDPSAVAYIVSVPESVEAMALIKTKVAAPDEDVEDLGHVSEDLLNVLRLKPGEFLRLDKRGYAALNHPGWPNLGGTSFW
jgi:hypothetical protein